MDNAVPERIAATEAIPRPRSNIFSWEMMARPQLMLAMNMNQIAHHSLRFSRSPYRKSELPYSWAMYGYLRRSRDDPTITAAYIPPMM